MADISKALTPRDRLQRLVDLGVAEEITGRARDRVFVYAGAWGLV